MTGSTAPLPNARDVPTGASRVGRQRFAAAWTQALMGTSYVPMTGAEVEGQLRGGTDQLVDALIADPFDPSPAEQVGADLVAAHGSAGAAVTLVLGILPGPVLDLAAVAGEFIR